MLLLSLLKFLALFLIFPLWGNSETRLQEANASYQQGVTATTFEGRKQAFNRALYMYSLLEEELGSRVPALNQALADTYFQLGEFAWAILYYQRALKSNPHDETLISQLKEAQQKLGLPSNAISADQNPIIRFLFKLSRRFDLLLSILLLTFLTCSLAIWVPSAWGRLLAASSVVLLSLLLGNLLFFYYFTPLEGILVTSTGFYRAPDWNQPQLTNRPLLAGSKIKVLQTTSEGNWSKIEDSTNLMGYIPTTSLRLI